MESFYGGRAGISFVISKRFDGIDIPEHTLRTGDYYATENNGAFVIINNKPVARTVENQDNPQYIWRYHFHDGSEVRNGTEVYFKDEWAQGMMQFFAKGADTIAEVGYGEYVIIDTIGGLHNYNAIENGIVYRRGMNYQQLPGIDTIKEPGAGAEYIGQIIGPQGDSPIVNMDTISNIKADKNFDSANSGEGVSELVSGKTNDTIKYAWVEMIDDIGNITGIKLGFTFPYTVFNFTAKRTDAYTNPKFTRLTKIDGNKPFYYEWELTVPEGLHGTDAKNFRIVEGEGGLRLVYDEYDYTNNGNPTANVKDVGAWKNIDNVVLEEDGTLTFHFTNGPDTVFPKAIRWLKPYNGIKIESDGTVKFTDNAGLTSVFPQQIPWVTNASLDDKGHFYISYNNDKVRALDKTLRWIDECQISEDGTITFYYCTDEEAARYDKYLKWVDDIKINTGDIEGAGNQKMTVTYNTGETQEIGNSLNYIIETVVTDAEMIDKYNLTNVKPFHLLVLYADPARRGDISYPSIEFNKVRNDWKDLGYIRGEAGVLRIIGNFDSINSLQKNDGTWLKPEEVQGYNEDRIGWGYTIGEKDFYLYDYNKKIWYSVGQIGSASNPKNVVGIGATESSVADLQDGGIWFILEQSKSV